MTKTKYPEGMDYVVCSFYADTMAALNMELWDNDIELDEIISISSPVKIRDSYTVFYKKEIE